MKEIAQADAWQAVEHFGTPEAQQLFNKISGQMWTTLPPRLGWSEFFKSSICTAVRGSDARVLALYDDPYCDVVLLLLWERQNGQEWRFSDVEAAPGSFIRKSGRPPFSTTPPWLEQKLPAPLAIALVSYQTFTAFTNSVPTTPPVPPLTRWRTAYGTGLNEDSLKGSRAASAAALQQGEESLTAFLADKVKYRAADEILAKLQKGSIEEVLNLAKETPVETANVLRKVPTIWSGLHLAAYVNEKDGFDLCFDTTMPETFITLSFRLDKARTPLLARIDVMSHKPFREYLATKLPQPKPSTP